MFDRRLKLGTFAGIGLFVHWTFALLLGFFAYDARDQGVVGMLYAVLVVLGMFLCVTLHEYGHALAARAFGIPTVDITLLPIGGVARLQRMPRIPWQELVVAVAGPAVNVVLGSMILSGLLVLGRQQLIGLFSGTADQDIFTTPSLFGFFFSMLGVNIALVIFNMIPAFPMDGGRVLRSVLAMVMNYGRATFVASRVGLVCAVIMAVLAISYGTPIPLLIAVFIAYAGMTEARQVEMMESIRGLRIEDAMVHHPPAIEMDTPLSQFAERWSETSLGAMPVVAMNGIVVGMLRIGDVAKAVQQGVDPRTTAGQLADHDVVSVPLTADLETVLASARHGRQLPVVDEHHRLVGLLDLNSLIDRSRMARVARHHSGATRESFNIVS